MVFTAHKRYGERSFLFGYCIFAIFYPLFLMMLDHYHINRDLNDELLILFMVPMVYSAIYYSRKIYLIELAIAVFASLVTVSLLNKQYVDDFTTVYIFALVTLGMLEIIYRDAEYRRKIEQEKIELNQELQSSLENLRRLSEMLPICTMCKRISTNEEAWLEFESYLRNELNTEIVNSLCENCVKKFVSEFSDESKKDSAQDDLLRRFEDFYGDEPTSE